MKIPLKLHLEWLKNELNRSEDSFRHSEAYKILKEELSKRGNWKRIPSNPRGNPSSLRKNSNSSFM